MGVGACAGNVEWLEHLSPWPVEGFGLERMQAVLAELGDPQLRYPAIHVVGTNGKTTATRTIEALLGADGWKTGATVSPHVRDWSERITVAGEQVDVACALAGVRPVCEPLRATQFETITAAALNAFAEAAVDVAVVEAGLGGRLDATNVLRTRVVLLTNVGLEHTDVLGSTVDEIAREKLAVVHEGNIVVMSDDRFLAQLPCACDVVLGDARAAAEAFAGHPIGADVAVSVPGRLERRRGEVRDGAHNADGVAWLTARLPPDDYTVCASILRDKDAATMLSGLARIGRRLVSTQSTNPRALPAEELAALAAPYFEEIVVEADPVLAVARAHRLGEPVLVTGSLYLLADLERREREGGSGGATA